MLHRIRALVHHLRPSDVFAGVDYVDVDVKIRACANAPTGLLYDIRKEQSGTAVTKSITVGEFDDLVNAASSFSAFDTEASSTLGAWYDNLPETAGNEGKTAFWRLMEKVRDTP